MDEMKQNTCKDKHYKLNYNIKNKVKLIWKWITKLKLQILLKKENNVSTSITEETIK